MYQHLPNNGIMVETTCLSTKKASKQERKYNETFRSAITYRKIQSNVLHTQGAIEPQIFIFETVRSVELQVMIQVFWKVKPC